jgi:hypothetical protein
MFNNLFKDKNRLFSVFLGGFTVFIILFIFNQYTNTENLEDGALMQSDAPVEGPDEELVVDPAKQIEGLNPVLPVQSKSSVGPPNSGQPIEPDPIQFQESFTEAKTSITPYPF